MPFVTTVRFHSGNRERLDGVVEDLKQLLERKGVDCAGPHTEPAATYRVPQYRNLAPDSGDFGSWEYTVYHRQMEIHGSDHIAGRVGHMEFPAAVHVEIDVERKRSIGSS
jgi:ribosomal protein S10